MLAEPIPDVAKAGATRRFVVLPTAYLILIFTFLYLPILVLVLLAFNDSPTPSFPFRGLTLSWFSELVGDQAIVRGLYNSFIVAIWTTVLAVLVGTMAAYALVRYSFKGRVLFAVLVILPVVIPKTVLGIAMLAFINYLELSRTLATVVIGHTLFCLPFVVIIVGSVIIRVEKEIVEASHDLGAGELRTFFTVVLPLILNGIVAGCFVAFILSFSEFNLSFFLSGRDQTVPLVVFSQARFEITPKINALAVIMVGASVALTFAAEYFRTRRAGKSRQK